MPTDLSSAVLYCLCTLLTIAVAWLCKTVIEQGKELIAVKATGEASSQAHEEACRTCKTELNRRIDEGKSETDRRFCEISETLKSINEKLDRALRERRE